MIRDTIEYKIGKEEGLWQGYILGFVISSFIFILSIILS